MAQEKSHPTKATHKEATEALHKATAQLDRVRGTIAHHMAEIARIKALLKDCESSEEECSSSGEGSPPRPGSKDSPATTPQGHDDGYNVEMENVGNTSNSPQGMATQTDPPEEDLEDPVDDPDVIVEDDQIITEGGGITPITPADDRLLDLDDQEG